MIFLPLIQETIEKIGKISTPESIFLYGSRARDDFLPSSDYEIGVLYDADNMVEEEILKNELNCAEQFRFYPYEINSFVSGIFDIPFEATIFLRTISLGSKTIWGRQIVEKMTPPPITVVSLMREIKFQLGRASDAIVCAKNGSSRLTSNLFFKSCLCGTRVLIILTIKTFPLSYPDIVRCSKEISFGKYEGIVEKSYRSRLFPETNCVTEKDLLLNVWYLNKFVERQITDLFNKEGNVILIK